MSNASSANSVRQRIAAILTELGAPADAVLRDTILIRGGFYVGHRLKLGELTAVWFLEEQQLKIYAANGALLATVDLQNGSPLAEYKTATRMAA